MSEFSITEPIFGISQVLLLVVLSPLIVGIMRKTKAKSQKRVGSPIIQPYFDILKLVKKEEVVSDQSSWIFRCNPWVNFATTVSAAFFIPVSIVYSPFGVIGDILLVIGLFGLGKFFTILSGLDVSSSFGGLGSSREIMFSVLVEPALLITIFVIAIFYGGTNISMIVTSANEISFLASPGVIFALIAFFIILMVETGKLPFDNPLTHLELTMIHEATVLEYSGKSLALIEWSQSIKQIILLTLFVNIFIPWGISDNFSLTEISFGMLFIIVKIISLGILITLIETRIAKWRLFRVPDLIVISIASSMIGVVFFFI